MLLSKNGIKVGPMVTCSFDFTFVQLLLCWDRRAILWIFFSPLTRCNFLKHLLVLESIQFTGCQNSEIIKLYLTQMHLKKFKSTFFLS